MKSDWAACICVIYGTDHSVCVTIIDTGKGFDIWEKAQRLDFQRPPPLQQLLRFRHTLLHPEMSYSLLCRTKIVDQQA